MLLSTLALCSSLSAKPARVSTHNQLPADIADNADLDDAVSKVGGAARRTLVADSVNRTSCRAPHIPPLQLPSNYNFEIKKTVWRVRQAGARRVALQFPEGLLLFACTIADIVSEFTGAEVRSRHGCRAAARVRSALVPPVSARIGAYIADDYHGRRDVRRVLRRRPWRRCVRKASVLARQSPRGSFRATGLLRPAPVASAVSLGADFMVHYGHSCLVPIDAMASRLRMLYVFVDVAFDVTHLVACVRANFPAGAKLALLGTIQFASALHAARDALAPHFPSLVVPQAKPLSPGEVLGCTSPNLGHLGLDAFVFVADGRFHLESVMIHNPGLPAFRCDAPLVCVRAKLG